MSVKNKAIAGVAAAGVVVLAWEMLPDLNPFYTKESDQVAIEKQKIESYEDSFTYGIGHLVTSHNIELHAVTTMGVHIPGTSWDLKVHHSDGYHGKLVTDAGFALKGAAYRVKTTRNSLDSMPLPDDKITAQVDRSAIFLDRPRDIFASTKSDTSYTVKDGFVTERGGQPVIEKERIFAKDGKYNIPKSHLRGSPSKISRIVNNVTLDNVRPGENSYDHMLQAGQVEAQDPKCVEAAWKVVSPDTATIASVTDELTLQGYSRQNINVELRGKWPKPVDLKDEAGFTYRQHLHDLRKSIPGDQKLHSTNECETGNVKNTLKHSSVNTNVAAGRQPSTTKR